MKTPQKAKTQPRKSARSRTQPSAASVKLAHEKRPVLRHFRLVSHKHTGTLIHFRHTSHVALMGILVLVGFFLVISQNLTQAANVTVGVVVQGPAPSVGALITSPIDGFSIVNLNPVQVEGTCAPRTFVVAYNDNTLAGSTICSNDGVFSVGVQLHTGKNVLTARNFDDLNQPGPDTPAVTVNFSEEEVLQDAPKPDLPENPVIIPGVTGPNECEDYNPSGLLTTGGKPRVAVVCVPRTIEQNKDHRVGILVWGGTPPYALSFEWGSGESTLISMDAPGYRTVKVHYASSGVYNINVKVTDRSSNAATGESAVEVVKNNQPQTFTDVVNGIFTTSWFETPVPLYVIAVGLTMGFWAGDLFDRHFGARRLTKQRRRRA